MPKEFDKKRRRCEKIGVEIPKQNHEKTFSSKLSL
jgi:hypothetical protein